MMLTLLFSSFLNNVNCALANEEVPEDYYGSPAAFAGSWSGRDETIAHFTVPATRLVITGSISDIESGLQHSNVTGTVDFAGF